MQANITNWGKELERIQQELSPESDVDVSLTHKQWGAIVLLEHALGDFRALGLKIVETDGNLYALPDSDSDESVERVEIDDKGVFRKE